jgi:quercetin dioxygenase-like cupin family protein
MLINADLSVAAVVETAAMSWVASPIPGVERRMLERDGEEVARATSLVRYAPGSAFSPHRHDEGEEFLVLDGVFSDESGDFPRGFYIRNPPGSRHRPSSAPGATIFVKLRQMPPQEAAALRVDTNNRALWIADPSGRAQAVLFDAPWERVEMIRLPPGAADRDEQYPGGCEQFVVEGALRLDGIVRPAGTWMRYPAGARLRVGSADGALIYRKTGHLAATLG